MSFLARISLTRYLLVGGFAVLLVGMLVMGTWISTAIEKRVIHHEGELFALYVDSVISDHVQSLAGGASLSDEDMIALDKLLYRTWLGERIVAFKMWSRDGRVLYSTDLTEIGVQSEIKPALAAAFRGETQSQMSTLSDGKRQAEGAQRPEVIEIFAPVHHPKTRSILAVSQIYQTGDVLARAVGTARRESWAVVVAATTVMYLLLAALIRRASNTIVMQQQQLREKVSQLTILLAQNEHLHERVARAAERTTALNERFLHRIAADLHDGPGQGLSLALMRMQTLAEMCSTCQFAIGGDRTVAEEFGMLQQGLQSALQDMRSIAKGLHSPPDIDKLSLADIARRAVRDYERTSGVIVELTLKSVPDDAPLPVKITLFRLLQESLANGCRHGAAVNQRVLLYILDNQLQLEVRDGGKGFDPQAAETEGHLGLEGMRERVEILGGTFVVLSAAGQGTLVRAALPLTSAVTAHD
jgi:signal transduction histidine kinase